MTVNELRLFPVGVAEELRSYVYMYVDPRNDEVFYIGKGENNRVFSHLKDADDLKRNSRKVERIRTIWNAGHEVLIRVHRHGMTPDQAFHVEASLIELHPDSENEVEGHHSSELGDRLVTDLVSEKQREKAEIDFPAVLINIRKEWLRIRPNASKPVDRDQLYKSTRTAWDIQPLRHTTVKYAISTAFGIIREVYNISDWVPAIVNADGSPRDEDGRWMFNGNVAAEKQYLVGKAIDFLQKAGAQNPIKWLDKHDQKDPVSGVGDISAKGSIG